MPASPTHDPHGDRGVVAAVRHATHDFGGWLAHVLAAAAAELGSTDALTAGRPGVLGGRARPAAGQGHRRLGRRAPAPTTDGRRATVTARPTALRSRRAGPRRRRRRAPPELRCVAALAYAVAGWPVLPAAHPDRAAAAARAGAPACASAGKHPRTRHGLQRRQHRPGSRSPRGGRAGRTPTSASAPATLVVLDVDGPDGARSLAELEAAHEPLPATRRAQTARGEHLYFHAAGHAIASSAGRLGPGLDVRGRGGYIVAPPSRHATGHRYAWTTSARRSRRCPPGSPRLLTSARAAARARALPAGRRGRRRRARAPLPAGRARRRARATSRARRSARATRRSTAPPSGSANSPAPASASADAARRRTPATPPSAPASSDIEARATIASGLGAGQRHPRPLPAPRRVA